MSPILVLPKLFRLMVSLFGVVVGRNRRSLAAAVADAEKGGPAEVAKLVKIIQTAKRAKLLPAADKQALKNAANLAGRLQAEIDLKKFRDAFQVRCVLPIQCCCSIGDRMPPLLKHHSLLHNNNRVSVVDVVSPAALVLAPQSVCFPPTLILKLKPKPKRGVPVEAVVQKRVQPLGLRIWNGIPSRTGPPQRS